MTDESIPPWVTASQIAQAEYCPYQLYLSLSGETPDKQTLAALDRGSRAHDGFNQSQPVTASARSSQLRWLAVCLLLASVILFSWLLR